MGGRQPADGTCGATILLRAPGHPLCLAATGLLLLNDHLLDWPWPGRHYDSYR